MVPVANTFTTVPVVVSTPAVASRTSTPVMRLISCRSPSDAGVKLLVKLLDLGCPGRTLG